MRLYDGSCWSIPEALENALNEYGDIIPTRVEIPPYHFICACAAMGSAYGQCETFKLRIRKPDRFMFVDIVPRFSLTEPLGVVYSMNEAIGVIKFFKE